MNRTDTQDPRRTGQQALARLTHRAGWHEVLPSDEVREGAERILGVHRLRAADALQLSAALVWCWGKAREVAPDTAGIEPPAVVGHGELERFPGGGK